MRGLGREEPGLSPTASSAGAPASALRQKELHSSAELPLMHALIEPVVSLFNLFIRLFSNLRCGNYSVNYSQHNKILIMHSYFRLLRDMIIWPQNQGHM